MEYIYSGWEVSSQDDKESEMSVIEEAKKITESERMGDYGHPSDSFKKVSLLWNAYIENETKSKITLKPKDVAFMMTLFKIAREQGAHKRDNIVDAIGYLYTYCMIEVNKK